MSDDRQSGSNAPPRAPWPTDEEIEEELRRHGIDPDSSPFEAPGVEGIPFAKDSEEARAIRRILEQAEREKVSRARSARPD